MPITQWVTKLCVKLFMTKIVFAFTGSTQAFIYYRVSVDVSSIFRKRRYFSFPTKRILRVKGGINKKFGLVKLCENLTY